MKLTLSPRVVRGPFAFAFGFLLALCLGLAGCASPPLASGYAANPTDTPNAIDTQQAVGRDKPAPAGVSGKLAGPMPETVVARPYSGLHLPERRGNINAPDTTAPSAGLRQFTADGHVLGFADGSVLVATGNHSLKVEFVNANPVAPQSDQPGGDGKDNKAPALSEVRYPGLWQGIDLAYKADPNGIAETVWKLEPGADIHQARLRYNRPLTLNQDGSLNIRYPIGNLTESAPIAWQEKNGQRQPVAVAFALNGAQELGFKLGDHDPALPVWIDPTLSWNTFLGGTRYAGIGDTGNAGNAIAVDGSGNVYVAGQSDATWGSPQRAFAGGGYDAFVAKLDSKGQLVWNTFLGGTGSDLGHGIAVDGNGNVYVAGSSSATWGSPQRVFGGCSVGVPLVGDSSGCDAFAAKLDNSGQLVWDTFLGGAGYDVGWAIAVDGSGNAYVAGGSNATWGSPQRAFGSGEDAFAAKLDDTGQLVWNNFLSTTFDIGEGRAIAVDGDGNVYVAGSSYATWGSPQRAFGGGAEAFAAKLDSLGQLVWNTFLGGAGEDEGYAIAVDGSGNAYVAGRSRASWGSPQRAFGSNLYDAFAAKLDSTGTLVWNTFLGRDPIFDEGRAIAVDSGGNAYVTGYSGHAAKLDNSIGQLVWNTSLGSTLLSFEKGNAIAVDGSGNVYVAGINNSFTPGSSQMQSNAFVAKLAGDVVSKANQTITFGPVPSVTVGGTAAVSATGGASGNPVVFASTTTGVCTVSGNTVTGVSAGICAITADQAGNASYNAAPQATQRFSIGQPALQSQTISLGTAPTLLVGGSGTLSATGGASGNPVVFASTTTGVCTVSGNTVTGVSAGICAITANQTGNASYNAAPQAILNFTVSLTNNPQRDAAAECLFNWAEKNYSHLFGPSGIATQTFGVYNYRHYADTNGYLGVSSADEHVYYQGADGILQDEGALSEWLPKAGCAATPPPALNASECLFNWAEKNYSNLFAPVGAVTSTWETYNYRHYATTNAYLGVSTSDNHVYYMGPDGEMADQGPTSKWLPLAGCQ